MRLSKSDALVTATVLSLSALLFYFYLLDVNASFSTGTGSSIGKVVFKKRSATRKTNASLGWERLRNASPIFSYDTLRTADLSEASIYFEDGTSLDILNNTMLKINFVGAQRDLEFTGGAIELGGAGAAATSIKIGDKTLTTGADSRISLSGTEEAVTLEVASGTATLQSGDGSTAQIGVNQEARIDVATGTIAVRELELVPRSPQQNARLGSSMDETPIDFVCAVTKGDAEGEPVFEFASDADFTENASIVPASMSAESRTITCSIPLQAGVWFWRARIGEDRTSNTRRLTLNKEEPIVPAQPADGAEYAFRKRRPRVRFSWAENADATSYTLEVSADPAFSKNAIRTRTNISSIDIDSLEVGTWYWRVVPDYPFTHVGAAVASTTREFTIVKREEMPSLTPVFPGNGTLFELRGAVDGLSFSWKPNAEATSYEIVVSAGEDLSSPAARLSCAVPYIVVKDELSSLSHKPASWYWAVRWKDEEGNFSRYCEPRLLTGVDGRMAVRLTYPPDGYSVADTLVRGLRFAWKSNVSAKTVFQVARDEGFTELVLEEPMSTETTLGRDWTAGIYRWRVRTYNADGQVFLETPSRLFTVAQPLPAPVLKKPSPLSSFVLREQDSQTLEWENGVGIDYVSVELKRDGERTPRVSIPMSAATKVDLPLGTFPDGLYTVRLQGFAMDKELSTRMIGYAGENTFYYKKLAYAQLVSPVEGAEIDGLSAIRGGIPFVWAAQDAPDSATLVISRDKEGKDVVLRKRAAARTEIVPRLSEGLYYWTLLGSIESFDISARETRCFTVHPVPKLPAPTLLAPLSNLSYDVAALRTVREPIFEWSSVEGANRYVFTLRSERDDAILVEEHLKGVRYTLTDLKKLSRNAFFWTVEARFVNEKDTIEQYGEKATSRFIVDLPTLGEPHLKTAKTLYGR